MKRRPSSITPFDEVEQALGLEIFVNVGAAVSASEMPQAGLTLRVCSPEAARVQQPDGSWLEAVARGNPRHRVCVAHHGLLW